MTSSTDHVETTSPGALHLTTSSQRVPELDGLRGVAIFLVIVCHYIGSTNHNPYGYVIDHAWRALTVGWSGVDLFFVLSGFLIGGILLESRNSPRYFRTFYLRRVHRILPIYYLWILLYAVAVCSVYFLLREPVAIAPGQPPISPTFLHVIPKYVLFLQNIFYGPNLFEWIWFIVTWSLAVEEQFYLLAPPLIRFLSEKAVITVLVVTVLVAPVLRAIFFLYVPQMDHFYQFGMPCRADALSLGVLAAIAWRRQEFRTYLFDHPALLQRALIILGLGLIPIGVWLARAENIVTCTIGYSWLGFFFVCLLLLVLTQKSLWLTRLIRTGWLRALGGISYCVYLTHLTINQIAHHILFHSEPRLTNWRELLTTVGALCLTLALAVLSWRFYEKPLIRRGHSFQY